MALDMNGFGINSATGFQLTPGATNGTWIEYANANGVGTLPEGDYNSFDPMSDLLGCPLNGEWTISVQDLWGIDNGFIFEKKLSPDHLNYDFRYFKVQGDKEYVFQTGLIGKFSLEDVKGMYGAVK